MLLSASSLSAQGYDELWKQADEAARKDLPKTQMDILEKIVKKAQKDKEYGHLLKAQLKHSNLQMVIAPDSLAPVMERLEQQTRAGVHSLRVIQIMLRHFRKHLGRRLHLRRKDVDFQFSRT